MSNLAQLEINDVVAAAQSAQAEIAASLASALGITSTSFTISETAADASAASLRGSGLALLFSAGGVGAALVVPEDPGILPTWYAAPDASGQSRLATLAQELGTLLLPGVAIESQKAARLDDIAAGLERAGYAADGEHAAFNISAEGRTATAWLCWPLARPAALLTPSAGVRTKLSALAGQLPPPRRAAKPTPTAPEDLPLYSRSLLRIEVPVVVTLARKRQPLGRVVEIGPGSMLQFDKSCEEMLDLEVGGRPIAQGEAVKVGDKFGLRISSVVLPEERFQSLAAK